MAQSVWPLLSNIDEGKKKSDALHWLYREGFDQGNGELELTSS